MKGVPVKINGKEVILKKGENLLSAMIKKGYDVPSLCNHPDIKNIGSCNLCLVEVKGELFRSCELKVEEGMKIVTSSKKVTDKVKENLEEILHNHLLECNDCVLFQKCKLLNLAKRFDIRPDPDVYKDYYTFKTGSLFIDQAKCIGCENCTKVCPTKYLKMSNGRVEPCTKSDVDCINCGQCINYCPVGTMEGEGEFENLERIKELLKEKVVVVQFAPSIRTSIGEEFGMKAGTISTGKLVAALRKVGFHYIFDTATGADFTTIEEAEELLDRISKKEKLPAMSSCCPAWVKFLEFNYPQYIDNLCTSRSPQIMLGSIIKEYWSEIKKIDPKDIFVVSVMPCIAKKEEIKREELKVNGLYPVDMVITTREAARLFKSRGIDFKNIMEEETDNPLGDPSGAGVIYGSSGGVFESALRTALFKATGEKQLEVKEIRGSKGIKKKEIRFGEKTLRVCVVSGIANAVKALKKIDSFDAVEVMACPGGCVGGGGQPIPVDKKTIKERSKGLYSIDKEKKIRFAHENKSVLKVYDEFFSKEKREEMLHTSYAPRKKTKIIKKERI